MSHEDHPQLSHEALIERLHSATLAVPFDHLGHQRRGREHWLLCWFPEALKVARVDWNGSAETPMQSLGGGLFGLQIPAPEHLPYLCRYRVTWPEGSWIKDDPYLLAGLTFPDLPHDAATLYRNQGAQLLEQDYYGRRLQGTRFAVYAPHASSVSVLGDFNHWDGRIHPMASGDDGVWRLFIPEVGEGAAYKFQLHSAQGHLLPHKCDPFAAQIDQYPSFASRVFNHDRYKWGDADWQSRPVSDPLQAPLNIYECHLGSWRRYEGMPLDYRELARDLVPYLRDMGYTHIELLPVTEHPFTGSWGYQPLGMFAPTSRYGSPDDFKYLVDQLHQAGIGVIMDWVPAHFPADAHGLANFDGTPLYEYPDPRKGWHPEWNSLIYDYGRESVCTFLISSAMCWLERFHIDGLRVDAVASMLYLDYSRSDGAWVANQFGGNHNLEAIAFLKRLNETLYLNFPAAITIAEESTAFAGVSRPTWQGGLGFGLKWNMGWMNDTLRYMQRDYVYRRYHHNELTFAMMYAYSEHFVLAISHDEVVHGKRSLIEKMPGDPWQRFASLRAFTAYQMTHPGKKLSFMGHEIAPYREWNHEQSLDWHLLEQAEHLGQQQLVRDLNQLYRSEPALYQLDFDPEGFHWLVVDDPENSVLAFARHASAPASHVLVILNFTPVPRPGYRLGVPAAGIYQKALCTDDGCYGGTDYLKQAQFEAGAPGSHGQPAALEIDVPPLAAVILKPLGPAPT